MKIDCIADLHGFYPELPGGDLLIIAGDLTKRDSENELALFDYWLNEQKYEKIVVIAGNHDNFLQKHPNYLQFCNYLCDSGTEFESLKIWGSPWTLAFEGENPNAMAFTCKTEEELAEKFALIPADTDILVTHSPPFEILDSVRREVFCGERDEHVGSEALLNRVRGNFITHPKLWVWGHIHESYGQVKVCNTTMVNASQVNERYEPVNKPVRINL